MASSLTAAGSLLSLCAVALSGLAAYKFVVLKEPLPVGPLPTRLRRPCLPLGALPSRAVKLSDVVVR